MSHSSAVVPTDRPVSPGPDISLAVRVILAFIAGYQVTLSPLVGGCCRHEPSCSKYATQAVQVHGAGRGLLLAIRRLSRCRPFGTWGYDPVPPSRLGSSNYDAQATFALRATAPKPPSLTELRRPRGAEARQ